MIKPGHNSIEGLNIQLKKEFISDLIRIGVTLIPVMRQISLECFLKRLVDNRRSDSVKPTVGRATIINSGSFNLYLMNVDSGKKYPTAANYGSNNGLHSACYMYEHATCFPFKYGLSFQDGLRFCT